MTQKDRVYKSAFIDAYDSFTHLASINFIWLLLTLPILTAPGALAGMYYAVREISEHGSSDWGSFKEGFRLYFWHGLRWLLLNVLLIVALVGNFIFYANIGTSWAPLVQGIYLGLLILWLVLSAFTFPLLLEQEDRRLRVALRNSFVLLIKRPDLTISLFLLSVLIIVVSSILILPWVFLTVSLIAFLAIRTVQAALKE